MIGFKKDGKFRPTEKSGSSVIHSSDINQNKIKVKNPSIEQMKENDRHPSAKISPEEFAKARERQKNFTLKDYEENEDINHHTENAVALVEKYGMPSEIKEIHEIQKNHMDRGHILHNEIDRREKITGKYYRKLVDESKPKRYDGSEIGCVWGKSFGGKLYCARHNHWKSQ